jgi:hypothetical protein
MELRGRKAKLTVFLQEEEEQEEEEEEEEEEGIQTHLPSWRARWVYPSWDSQLCRDNTDAVREGNAIGGQFRSR